MVAYRTGRAYYLAGLGAAHRRSAADGGRRDASGPDMRVLLVARSAGEWWQQLINGSSYQLSELLAAVRPITLGPVCGRPSEQEVFHDALVTFAAELGVACRW